MNESTLYYRCPCGHRFLEVLGVYGCPNCEGESGPARLEEDDSD